MRTRSQIAKANRAKGHRAQKLVAAKLLEYYPALTALDICERQGSCNGTDLLLTTQAVAHIPWAIEVKSRKKISLIDRVKKETWCSIRDTDLHAVTLDTFIKEVVTLAPFDWDNLHSERIVPKTAFIMESFKQALANMDSHYKIPILVLKQDRDPTLIVVYNYYDFLTDQK